MTPWFYVVSKAFVRIVLTLVGRISAIDAHRVPRTGPLILACNHVAYLDPPAIGCVTPRVVTYMAKKELFDIALLGLFIRPLGAFPIDRSRGDVAAMKAAIGILATGACLGIFPEGTRNKDGSGKPQLGVALLASLSGAPVVPVYVSGTSQAKRLAKITVVFGEPIRFTLGRKARREDLAKWTDELMGRIYALREKIDGD
ncbi:MAG: lysophospholipid acyltransferase family protein [Vulcanimicrobiaceae bacterium]